MKTISIADAMKLSTKRTVSKETKKVAKKATPRKTEITEEPKKKRGRPTKQEQVKKALKVLDIPEPEPPTVVEEEKEEPRPKFKSSKPNTKPIVDPEAFEVLWVSKAGSPCYQSSKKMEIGKLYEHGGFIAWKTPYGVPIVKPKDES